MVFNKKHTKQVLCKDRIKKKKVFRLGTLNIYGSREFKIKLKTFIPLPKYSNTEVHTIFTGKTSHSSGLFNCNEKKMEDCATSDQCMHLANN